VIFNGIIGHLASIKRLTYDLKWFIDRFRDIGGGGFNPFAFGHDRTSPPDYPVHRRNHQNYHHFTSALPRPPRSSVAPLPFRSVKGSGPAPPSSVASSLITTRFFAIITDFTALFILSSQTPLPRLRVINDNHARTRWRVLITL
jgi:hypothetical protein